MKIRLLSILIAIAISTVGPKIRAQAPSFQPILLALDPTQDRLYAAAPSEERPGSRLLVILHPGKEGAALDRSFDLPGLSSGLAYDPDSETLFVANATGHEILIFDRINPHPSARPTRLLRRFNFPTGIYVDPLGRRLFVADAHPGALLLFERAREVEGERRPDRTIEGEETGLNGPFAIAADTERARLYVSNFDGVLVFDLRNLSIPPERLPLPRGTLARGLSFDPSSRRLYIATPMRRSFFIYGGEQLEEVKVEGAAGAFPFSLAIDPKGDRLYLAGGTPEIGVIEQASGGNLERRSPEKRARAIDRWIRWKRPPPLEKRSPPPTAPGIVRSLSPLD